MEISVTLIKELREKTGAGVIDCKKALAEARADMEKATEILKQQGLSLVQKKAARVATSGLIEAYVHQGGRIGAMVEVNCETDFVARTDEFRALAHDLALQVAAMGPQAVSPEDLPADSGLELPVACLLLQPFIKDGSKTVQDVINETIAKVGENIRVRRFARFEVGQ